MRLSPIFSKGGSQTAPYVLQFICEMDSSLDLVIFDCDGVLADTETLDIQVVSHLLKEAGLHISLEGLARRGSGLTDYAMWTMLEIEVGHPLPAGIRERRESMLLETFRQSLTPTPSLSETVRRLKSEGINICVASNGSAEKVSAILDIIGLSVPFGGRIFSADKVPRPKPHADLYRYVAQQMSTNPSQCVVVEDSHAGVQAALAAGMRVLGFCPNGDAQDLKALGVKTFGRMKTLPRLLGLDVPPC